MYGLYKFSILLIFALAALVFLLLFFITAPYGKFRRQGWGPSVKSKWAWMVMESPAPLLMMIFYFASDRKDITGSVFLLLWLVHYIHRSFIYPFTQSGRNKQYPVILVLMAITFNCLNGFVNGYGIFHLRSYVPGWILSWQFLAGIVIFISGFWINKVADERLRKFRKGNIIDYILPYGWLFNYVSCPHYFGEIIEWAGWALMTWSVPGLAFFTFTFANLFPRGLSSHSWYRKKFPEYPANRKAVIPFII
jgi:3-oxo-5-alpha-steroid 4-dehydrogenase 1